MLFRSHLIDFGNMFDDSQNDFFHPNQSNEMFADQSDKMPEDPPNQPNYPDFSNHFMTDEVC